MKVALISFHNAYNYGAALQAYGLQKALNDMDIDNEYIDYVNTHRAQVYNMRVQLSEAIKNKNVVRAVRVLCGMPFMYLRGSKFDLFYSQYLKKTDKTYSTSQEAVSLNDEYEKFIVGSDQVWNPGNNGMDWAFLLDFVKDKSKKISYSSSFGIDKIPEKYEGIYAKYLSEFDRLAVREKAGVEIVRKIAGREAHLVLDPVFLPNVDSWKKLADKVRYNKKKYIFFYTNRSSQVQEFLEIWTERQKLDYHILSSHVGIKDFLERHIKVKFSMSPEQFLSDILHSELVVTASFHCLAFAIIFNKQFMVFLTGDLGKDERVLNLLRITGLESRVINHNTTMENILDKINYDIVNDRIKPYMEHSKVYLYNAIFSQPDISLQKDEVKKEKLFCKDIRCSGCSACAAICPKHAIHMTISWDGFLIPELDKEKCVSCGLCHEVCQVYQNEKPQQDSKQTYYALKNNNDVRIQSSSGGVFTYLSDLIIEDNGVVVAPVMDAEYNVHHAVAVNKDERNKMRRTFYVQSDTNGVFNTIKKSLISKKKVLFVGTPCQVRGLQLYLQKDYDNLITCDLICHGVPSPGVFKKFIEVLKEKGQLMDFLFRDKTLGWSGYHVSAILDGKKIKNKQWLQSFNVLFSHNVINRSSCANCPYTSYDRPADITIGDFWGVKNSHKDFYDKLGVSLVLVNSKKGQLLFDKIKCKNILKLSKRETIQNSLKSPSPMSGNRERAFRLLERDGYQAVAEKFGEVNLMGWIKKILRKLFSRR